MTESDCPARSVVMGSASSPSFDRNSERRIQAPRQQPCRPESLVTHERLHP
jgi:hypothetical protein